MSDNLQKPMKWWGWGAEGEAPNFENKPHLWPYITRHLQLKEKPQRKAPPPDLETVTLPPAKQNEKFSAAMARCGLQVFAGKEHRLAHAGGKSFRDLWHARKGKIPCAPDAVLYPQNAEEAAAAVAEAQECDIAIIPFGGGSNIAGCLTPADARGRMVVAADTTKINRLLSLNEKSQIAQMQAGALGGVLEAQLNARGWTFGHFPDSFLHSTLGGWIATRSAGMQSDEYGCIENLTAGATLQTPGGVWNIKHFPRSAAAMNMKELVLGSEGALGIITEAVIKIRPLPARKLFFGYLFSEFASGLEAVRECLQTGAKPLISRLSDHNRTALSFSFREASGGGAIKKAMAAIAKTYIAKSGGIDFSKCCLMIVAFEGSEKECAKKHSAARRIFRKYGGVFAGAGPGESFARGKFDFPHIRDYLWDYGIYADVSETATEWENAENLRLRALAALEESFRARNLRGWCGCHLSHSYRDGASLYFSFAFLRDENGGNLAHYFAIKRAVQDAFAKNGGTLSHHHSVGTDHAPWLENELSPFGIAAMDAIKKSIDPRAIMNPGKLRPLSWERWRADIPLAEE